MSLLGARYSVAHLLLITNPMSATEWRAPSNEELACSS
jgi:hypothetical protein